MVNVFISMYENRRMKLVKIALRRGERRNIKHEWVG
jgi:hypothetical protein